MYHYISYTYLREYKHCDNIWEHIHHPQPAVTRVFASLAASSCTSGVCLICHESTKPSRWIPVGVCILSLCHTYLLVDKHKSKQDIITKIEQNLSLFKYIFTVLCFLGLGYTLNHQNHGLHFQLKGGIGPVELLTTHPWRCRGFLKWRYPKSWMVYNYNGTSESKMDDLGVPSL